MGGDVAIKSEPGKGTEITITLRFVPANPADYKRENLESSGSVDFSGKRLLLVEDNEMNREIACGILEELGFVVDRAENGVAAIDKVLHCKGCYDVILMDIQMPVMDGYKATGEIRRLSDSKLSGIPIIAMTANAFDEDKQRCLDAGMNAHIAKPIDVKALKSTLEKVLL